MTERQLIEACKSDDRKAQNKIYRRFAPTMMSICIRYLKNRETAEDILINAFYKVFTKIDSFNFNGSFEGWVKRIIINECLMELRRNKTQHMTVSLDESYKEPEVHFNDTLEYEELKQLLNALPPGYRTVFNLFVIEGYKHREIAEILGISTNTSKSQLILARRKLQAIIKKKYNIKISA